MACYIFTVDKLADIQQEASKILGSKLYMQSGGGGLPAGIDKLNIMIQKNTCSMRESQCYIRSYRSCMSMYHQLVYSSVN